MSERLPVPPKIAPLVAAIVACAAPRVIWLFGSRARGDHRSDSDWDLDVAVDDTASPHLLDPLTYWVLHKAARERAIVAAEAPNAPAALTRGLVAFVQKIRTGDVFKSPGVAETLDWATALTELDAVALDLEMVDNTLGVLLKYQDDIAKMTGSRTRAIIDEVRADLGHA